MCEPPSKPRQRTVLESMLHLGMNELSGNLVYLGLFVMAAITAIGVPGPGEGVLVAAAIAAAEGRLSLAIVLTTAFIGGVVGCQIGYWLGYRYGRALLERPGPLLETRLRIIEKGEALLGKYGALASFIVPSPICGIKRVPRQTFIIFSTLSRAWWAVSTGLVAYFVGENLTELIRRFTGAPVLLIIVVIAVAAGVGWWLWVERRNASGGAAQVPPGSA